MEWISVEGQKSCRPEQPLTITGIEGYETFAIDSSTIGVRPRWISIEDEKPPENEWIYLGSSIYQVTTWGFFLDNKFVNPNDEYAEIEKITHWMPIPEPPK